MFTSYLIDDEGFILQQMTSDEAPGDEPNVVRTSPSDGLIRPKWTGKRWSEGAREEERDAALYSARQSAARLFARVAEEVREQLSPAGPHAHAVREQKLREARAMLYGQGSEEPVILRLESEATGVDLKSTAARVLEAHKAWCNAMGRVEGQLRRYTDIALANESRQKLEGIVVEGCAAIRGAAWALLNPTMNAGPPPEEVGSDDRGEVTGELGEVKAELGEVKDDRGEVPEETKASAEASTEASAEASAEAVVIAIKDARPVESKEAVKEAVSLSETRSVLIKTAPSVELATSREMEAKSADSAELSEAKDASGSEETTTE